MKKCKKTVQQKLVSYLKTRKTLATLPQIMRSKQMRGVSENSVRPLLGASSSIGCHLLAGKTKCPVTDRNRRGYVISLSGTAALA